MKILYFSVSILTYTVASHLSTLAAFASTLHCGSPELHSGVQSDCYQVSDPSGGTPQQHHRRTYELGWQETVPTWTQSADSICCNTNQPQLLSLVIAKILPLVPALKGSSTITATKLFSCQVITIP